MNSATCHYPPSTLHFLSIFPAPSIVKRSRNRVRLTPPSPLPVDKLASLRKANMPSPDMQKFLYTILKQLDLKSVEWNQIAEATGITNGHAARMRYSRFKKQMEGHVPQRRQPRKGPKPGPKPKKKDEDDKSLLSIKLEREALINTSTPMNPATPRPGIARLSSVHTPPATPEYPYVKNEPCDIGMDSQISLPENLAGPPFGLETPLMEMTVDSPSTPNELMDFGSSLSGFDMSDSMFDTHYQTSSSNAFLPGIMDFHFQPGLQPRIPQRFAPQPALYLPSPPLDMNGRPVVKRESQWDHSFRS